MTERLANLLYHVSSVLLLPVLAGLAILSGLVLFALGGLLREWQLRRQRHANWQSLLDRAEKSDEPPEPVAGYASRLYELPGQFVASLGRGAASAQRLERRLADVELLAAKRLAWLKIGVRLGPLLGLMGTLIPMGPGLIALSHGQLETMAENMVIVFSTTVVGLLVGGAAYCMLTVRRQWYARDLAEIENLASQLSPNHAEASASVFDGAMEQSNV